IERSSRVLSGALLCSSILPPTCSRKVRSVVSTTRAAGSASIAARISSQCSGPRASTVMSRSVWWSSTLTRSTEPIVPPARPIAVATSPSMPGLCSISTRIVTEYGAGGVAATAPTLRGHTVRAMAADRPDEIYLIDGNSLVYRAFFALPESIATSTGFPTNAIFGFASMLVKLLPDNGSKPTVVVWDKGSSGRKEIYEEYKGHRPRQPDLLG